LLFDLCHRGLARQPLLVLLGWEAHLQPLLPHLFPHDLLLCLPIPIRDDRLARLAVPEQRGGRREQRALSLELGRAFVVSRFEVQAPALLRPGLPRVRITSLKRRGRVHDGLLFVAD
jgi:hypothetical protein